MGSYSMKLSINQDLDCLTSNPELKSACFSFIFEQIMICFYCLTLSIFCGGHYAFMTALQNNSFSTINPNSRVLWNSPEILLLGSFPHTCRMMKKKTVRTTVFTLSVMC